MKIRNIAIKGKRALKKALIFKLLAAIILTIVAIMFMAGCIAHPSETTTLASSPSSQDAQTAMIGGGGGLSIPAPATSPIAGTERNDASPTPTLAPTLPPSVSMATTKNNPLTMLSITKGSVLLMKSGTNNWIEAQVGMTLQPGDAIKTGGSSQAQITFFEGSTIQLEPGTQITVDTLDIAEKTGSTTIKLEQQVGKTMSRIKKLTDAASDYEIETKTSAAVVRGSVMLVDVAGDGTTIVGNGEGIVLVRSQGVDVQIPEGMQSTVVLNGTPTPPEPGLPFEPTALTGATSTPSPTPLPSPPPQTLYTSGGQSSLASNGFLQAEFSGSDGTIAGADPTGTASCSISGNGSASLTVNIINAYPGMTVTIPVGIKNTGSVPIGTVSTVPDIGNLPSDVVIAVSDLTASPISAGAATSAKFVLTIPRSENSISFKQGNSGYRFSINLTASQ